MPTHKRTSKRAVVILLDRLRTGGTERQSVWLQQALLDRGWQSRLHLLYPKAAETSTRSTGEGALSLIRPTVGLIGEFRENCPDVLICMGRTANSLGFLVKRCFPSVQLVTTCRTNRKLPFLYRRSLRQSQLCIANSHWAAEEVVRVTGMSPDKLIHIENALLRPELFKLDQSPASKAVARRGLGLHPDSTVLCNISSFVPGKNKTALLEAFARSQFQSITVLLLAGDGRERQVCEQRAKSLGIAGQVRFLGRTDFIEPILQASDMFVSTSLRDSLPNALVEAQAAGLPVVAYDVAGAVEAFEPERSGISVRCGDVDGFVQAIDKLLGAPDLRLRFGTCARKRALQLYDPEVIRARYATEMSRLMA